jgi:PTS system galactitol-specific IIB component
MTKVRVLSVCGTGGVTSSVVSQKVHEIAKANGIEIEVVNSNAFDVRRHLSGGNFDVVVASSRVKVTEGIPVINCMAFLTGVKEEETAAKVAEALKNA